METKGKYSNRYIFISENLKIAIGSSTKQLKESKSCSRLNGVLVYVCGVQVDIFSKVYIEKKRRTKKKQEKRRYKYVLYTLA